MFTGIFTKILVGVIGALVISNAVTYVKYNWFDKPAYERQQAADLKEIKKLQGVAIQLRAEKYRLETEGKDQTATIKRKGALSHETQALDQIHDSNDDPAMRQYYLDHGMLYDPAPGTGDAKNNGAQH